MSEGRRSTPAHNLRHALTRVSLGNIVEVRVNRTTGEVESTDDWQNASNDRPSSRIVKLERELLSVQDQVQRLRAQRQEEADEVAKLMTRLAHDEKALRQTR